MKKNFLSLALGLAFSLATSVQADTYIEQTITMLGPTVQKIWVKSQKQRMEMAMPVFGSGPKTTITHFDKRLSWTINDQNKSYVETPIAAPQSPSPAQSSLAAALGQMKPQCTPEMEAMKESKNVAGYKAEGYVEFCKESPYVKRIYWFGPDNFVLREAKKEIDGLNPGQFNNAAFNGMFGTDILNKFPDRMLLAMETEMNGRLTSVLEIKLILTNKIDDSLFEVPVGYRKTDMAQEMTETINRMKELQKTQPQQQPFKKLRKLFREEFSEGR